MALELGMRGVSVMLIERRDGGVTVPKMGYVNPRTMEFCRRWGISEAVKSHGWPTYLPRNIVWLTSLTGKKIAEIKYPSVDDMGVLSYSPERGQRCSQLFFDPILLRRLRREAGVQIRHSCEMMAFAQDEHSVTCQVKDLEQGTTFEVDSAWLVACDGSASGIREASGIGMTGSPKVRHCTNVIFRSPNLWRYMKHGVAAFNWLVGPEGQWGNVISIDGDTIWRLSLTVGRPDLPLSQEEVAAYITRATHPDVGFEISSMMPWTRQDRLADRFRHGRIFLAGDSAHLLPPTGGLGMNSGMGDAVDLSWKLSAVLKGWAPEKLLETYDIERRQVLERNTAEAVQNNNVLMALPVGPEIADASPAGDALRLRLRTLIEGTPEYRTEYEQEGTVLGFFYDRSPLLIRQNSDPPLLPNRHGSDFVQVARVGGRAPHVWLDDNSSTLDRFGAGFSLVQCARNPADGQAFAVRAEGRNVPIALVDFSDHPAVREAYRCVFALIRPDGHIAWMGDVLPETDQEIDFILDTVSGVCI